MSRPYYRRRSNSETPEGGGDSFLDIVSNMVAIMIILVMIAGSQVGTVLTESDESAEEPPAPRPASESLLSAESVPDVMETSSAPASDAVVKTRYIEAVQKFEAVQTEGINLKKEVDELNNQLLLVENEANGADAECRGLMADIAAIEAGKERAIREKNESEKERIELNGKLRELTTQAERLEGEAKRLAETRPKATALENRPTPLAKKVEGKEGVFALREGKISHVPIGFFAERVRGHFRSLRDLSQNQIDETIGPMDGYLFHFQGSIHQVRKDDGMISRMIVFDYGELIPQGEIGETLDEALAPNSDFRQKLALYLKDSSVITLSVYPDSFAELRAVKDFLLKNDYSIAIRPMPMGKNIIISPNGTESTTY